MADHVTYDSRASVFIEDLSRCVRRRPTFCQEKPGMNSPGWRYDRTTVATPEVAYYPFHANWHSDSRWRRELARNPQGVRRALDGYRRVLTDHSIFAQSWAGHPLPVEFALVAGRWRVLETGAVLAQLRHLGDFRKRLLRAESYLQTCAELRAALLLQLMGLSVVREPSNINARPHERLTGPDWLAIRAGKCFGVEVKCPDESEMLKARCRLTAECLFRVPDLIGDKGVNIALNPDTIADSVVGNWPNMARAENLLLDALAESELTGSSVTPLGTVSPAPSGYASMVGPIPIDENHETERLRALLQGAAAQLRDWAPGVVIIDTSSDRAVINRCCRVAELMSEPWAAELGLVMFVADTYPGFVVKVVRGPRFASMPPLRVRTCAKGHFHVRCFGSSNRCDLDDGFDDYSAYCLPGVGHCLLRGEH